MFDTKGWSSCFQMHCVTRAPQDTPAVKFTYNAVLRVPQALTGLMSALPVEDAAQEWQVGGSTASV